MTHTTGYEYDADGNRVTVIDARGRRAVTTYTADGRVATTADPGNNVTSYTYDRMGNVVESFSPSANSSTDQNNTANVPTRYTYTQDNLVAAITVPRTPDGSEMRAVLRPSPARRDRHQQARARRRRPPDDSPFDDHQAVVVDEHPEHGDALAPAGCCRLVPSRPPTRTALIGGTMEPVTIGEEPLEERRRRRRAGDPRITPRAARSCGA